MATLAHTTVPELSQFTCNSCETKFFLAEFQRKHMKSDWHRYNLKRRVAGLPSITSELFAEKVLAAKELEEFKDEDEYGFHLTPRDRRRQQRDLKPATTPSPPKVTPINTRRPSTASHHLKILIGTDHDYITDDTGSIQYDLDSCYSVESDEFHDLESKRTQDVADGETIPADHCIFCGMNNGEIEANVRHMFKRHGLYIPERSFLSDLKGLLAYLSLMVSQFQCIVCSFQGRNLELVWQHMSTKGHCRIPYESKEDKRKVGMFYTFYEEPEFRESTGTKVAFTDSEQETDLDIEDDHGVTDNYQVADIDNNGELVLPNGLVIGTRNRQRQYRQYHNTQELVLREQPAHGTVAVADRRLASGLSYHQLTQQEVLTRRAEYTAKQREVRKTKLAKANYQKHFRDEMLQ